MKQLDPDFFLTHNMKINNLNILTTYEARLRKIERAEYYAELALNLAMQAIAGESLDLVSDVDQPAGEFLDSWVFLAGVIKQNLIESRACGIIK